MPHHHTLHLWGLKLHDQYSIPLIWQQTKVELPIGGELPNLFQSQLPPPQPELVDCLPAHLRNSYARDFCLADDAFYSGRLEATSCGRKKYWDHWQRCATPMGMDPYLQDTNFSKRIRLLSGFAAQVRTGFYGAGRQVKNCTVSCALMAVGQTIALACKSNPTKIVGSKCLLPCLQIMLDGYRKVDPPTQKKLPVQSDVPKLLVTTAYQPGTAEVQRATADLTMIAFYYLLRVGEYTVKGLQNNTKQTVQFKYEDLSFFKKNIWGQLPCLPCNAAADLILTADSTTLKLDNQKNGLKGVCVYHKANNKRWHCPVSTLAQCYLHLCNMGANSKTFLLVYCNDKGHRRDITNEDVSKALKVVATALDYPTAKGVPIDRIDTHSLQSGGANALSLAGYSDTQIQKMGRWRGATFKEYIHKELACFSTGMLTSMKRKFDFVNIVGNAFITNTNVQEYEINLLSEAAT